MFKLENLNGQIPANVIAEIPNVSTKFGITTSLRLSHFLSQAAHESMIFTRTIENLNYKLDPVLAIFKHDFDINRNKIIEVSERDRAAKMIGHPDKIANFVYANQNGNGNEASGDGWKFRGRGYIQLTGRANYVDFTKIIGEDVVTNPDLVATKYPLTSAAFFFNKNKLWTICDKGADLKTVTQLTQRINGGTNGLDDRIKLFNKYYNLLK
jgi:putative chitinase